MNLSSTLVETVSIDYDDFNESFLTCSTCLCNYDAAEHNPKLLPCSHTICLECLTRIVATFARDSQFRYCDQNILQPSILHFLEPVTFHFLRHQIVRVRRLDNSGPSD